jgi:hypothetical protein
MGAIENIDKLKGLWEEVLSRREDAQLLEINIDPGGVL